MAVILRKKTAMASPSTLDSLDYSTPTQPSTLSQKKTTNPENPDNGKMVLPYSSQNQRSSSVKHPKHPKNIQKSQVSEKAPAPPITSSPHPTQRLVRRHVKDWRSLHATRRKMGTDSSRVVHWSYERHFLIVFSSEIRLIM